MRYYLTKGSKCVTPGARIVFTGDRFEMTGDDDGIFFKGFPVEFNQDGKPYVFVENPHQLMDDDVLFGADAQNYFREALNAGPSNGRNIHLEGCRGYFGSESITAFDNRDFRLNEVRFDTEELAIHWLNGEIDEKGHPLSK
ncbi:MAG: hypothetical protein HPY53_01565 [Brevinematales bacterium]|nr:hypothetical protein [Brevinematales bacterium]